ncbi:DndE family protein [Jeotgalibacillus marinus]|uniref:DndE family protein n=1 Tax=Jeotgalibacillus marinus TaxID=86667 RepID=A0ABV3Q5I4_9BACL
MNFRLKTDSNTATTLKSLQSSTSMTPNILARLSIALSLKVPTIPELKSSDPDGLEFNRNTLTGDQDYFYKALIRQHSKRHVEEEEYFPGLYNAHLSRGCILLEQEYQHSGNYDKFISNLLK